MRTWLRWLVAAAGLSLGAARAELPEAVGRALARAGVPEDAISVLVAPVGPATTTARLSHRPDASMNPASVMKLVTTYAGLDLLGPEFRWRNRVYVDGFVANGVLDGHLILRGSGDPKLVLERIDALMREIQAAGVREIRGDILLDNSIFSVPDRHPGEFDDEPLRPYNARPDGLLVNFKSLILRFTPDPSSGLASVEVEPPIAGVEWPPLIALGTGPCADWRSRLRADFSRPDRIAFAGRYTRACGTQTWPVAYVDPRGYAPRVLRAMWQAAGGRLGGQVREASTPSTARLLLQSDSLPLSDIAADINKFSNNVMAQQLFLTLSAQAHGKGSFEASRERLRAWWRERFPGRPAPDVDNGSGLSRSERISASALVALLQRAASGPLATPYLQSLAVAGVDGTAQRMGERLRDSPLLGQARLKTGSLRDVAAVAGYVSGRDGTRYAVVAMVNHEAANAARPALDLLLDWVARDRP